MADDLIIDVGADIGDVDRKFSSVNKEVDKLEQNMSRAGKSGGGFMGALGNIGGSLGSMVNPLALATVGLGLLGGGLLAAGKAAAEEQVGMDRLDQTLRNSVKGYDAATAGVEDYVGSMTKLAFADDQIRDSLNFLVGQTGDLTEAQNLQATAMDLARAKGISLEQATKAVGKVDQESIGILKKLGVQVTENMTKEEALTAIREQTAGQAEKYAQSAAGSMERMQNAFGDAVEDIGGVVLPALTAALGTVAEFVSSPGFLQGFQAAVGVIGTGLGMAFEVLGGIVQAAWPIVQAVFTYLTSADVVTTLSTIAGIIGGVLAGAWSLLSGAIGAALPTIQGIFTFLGEHLGAALSVLAGILTGIVVPAFIAWATTMLTTTLPALVATMAPILAAAAPFIALGAAVAALWLAFDTNFLGIRDIVVGVWNKVQPVLVALGEALGKALVAAFTLLKDAALFVWNNVLSPFFAFLGGSVVQGAVAWVTNALGTVLVGAWNLFRDAALFVWNNVLVPLWAFFSGSTVQGAVAWVVNALGTVLVGAWNLFKGAAEFVWNNVLVPLWAFFSGPTVKAAVGWVTNALGTVLVGAWNLFRDAALFVWNNVLVPLWAFFSGSTVKAAVAWVTTAVGTTLVTAWNALKGAAEFLWNNVLVPFWAFFNGETVKAAISFIGTAIGTTLVTAWNALKGAAQFLWDNVLKPFFAFLTSEPVKGAITFIANALKVTIGGAFNVLKGIVETVGGVIKGILDGIKAAIDAVGKAWDWLNGKVAKGISAPLPKIEDLPQYKKKARGGPVRAGTQYLVGERGPELFTPGASGYITANNKLGGGAMAALTGGMVAAAAPTVMVYVDGVLTNPRAVKTMSRKLQKRARGRGAI